MSKFDWNLKTASCVVGLHVVLAICLTPSLAQSPVSFPVSASGGSVPSDVGTFEIQLQALEETTSAPVVTALAASESGRFLAAAGDDHAIRIVDVQSGRTISTFKGHLDWIQSLVFCNDHRPHRDPVAPILYSAGYDGRVLEWKYEVPVAFREIIRLPYAVRSITVSPAKRLLAIGGMSDEVLIWDLQLDRLKHKLQCECKDQRCVRFSPDGGRVLCGGRDGTIRVWDTQSGELLAAYQAHRRVVATAAFSADGERVTSVGEDRQLVQFDIPSGSRVWQRDLELLKMLSMCLINDNLIAAAGADNAIRVYDAVAEEVVAVLEGHTGSVAVMSPCGEFLASGSFDTTVRIWDLELIGRQRIPTGKPVQYAPLKMDANLRIR